MDSFARFEANGIFYYLAVIHHEGQLQLTIIDERLDLWESRVAISDLLSKVANKAGKNLSSDDYVELLKSALRRQDDVWTKLEFFSDKLYSLSFKRNQWPLIL